MSNKFNNPWGDDEGDDIFRKAQDGFSSLFKKSTGGDGKDGGNGLFVILPILFFVWIATGIYTVQPEEEAVILRFGRYNRTEASGLHYHLPLPIEKKIKLSVTRVQKEEVGFRSMGKRITSRHELLQNRIAPESQMLTGDENIVDVNFDVQWVIKDAKDYLFNVRELRDENTVKSAAESAMREVLGMNTITDVLAQERSVIEMRTKDTLQRTLDNYKMGVLISRVQLLRVEPPPEVIDAYRDVQSAKADKEKAINEAYAYSNDIIPRARGNAKEIIEKAKGYKEYVTAKAKGEAKRFSNMHSQYVKAKDVTRRRLYLNAMSKILSDSDKVILDNSKGDRVVPYLPLNELKKKKK